MRELTVGERLDQYQLTELLARSGMASIFKAVDGESGATVALKIPHPQLESDVVFFSRFKREEEIGQRLDHPNVVKMQKPRQKSRMYLAMEYVEGRSLRALLQAGAPLPTLQALDIARQVCEALVYLHGQKVVHRDIKPENVLLTPAGQVKILDFGIALDESARRLTWAGLSSAIGTPDYMAPEQIAGRRGDERTDVYAVGTILFEMLTGELPHAAPNPHALLRAKTNDDPRPPSYFVPAIDPALEAIIMRAIERVPRDRYASVAELLEHLRDPTAVPPREPGAAPRAASRRLRSLRRLGLPVLMLLAFAALVALVALSHKPESRPLAPPPAAHAPAAHREM
jgi:serine/threonine protein kinase